MAKRESRPQRPRAAMATWSGRKIRCQTTYGFKSRRHHHRSSENDFSDDFFCARRAQIRSNRTVSTQAGRRNRAFGRFGPGRFGPARSRPASGALSHAPFSCRARRAAVRRRLPGRTRRTSRKHGRKTSARISAHARKTRRAARQHARRTRHTSRQHARRTRHASWRAAASLAQARPAAAPRGAVSRKARKKRRRPLL